MCNLSDHLTIGVTFDMSYKPLQTYKLSQWPICRNVSLTLPKFSICKKCSFYLTLEIGSVVMSIQVAITQTMTYILTLEAQLPDVMYDFEMNNENACVNLRKSVFIAYSIHDQIVYFKETRIWYRKLRRVAIMATVGPI